MRATLACLAALALIAGAQPASAAIIPQPGPGDPRILLAPYDPTEVVELQATLGYQISIEFDPDERIENVAIGDALGWQVTPNHRANLLFLKPMARAPATNMTVVTNLRRYTFELNVRAPPAHAGDPSVIYGLRFVYPEVAVATAAPVEAPPPKPPQDLNHAYSYEGASTNVPTRIFDDGKATYFQFREGEDYPAIFAVDADGGEALVNSFNRDGYLVIDRVVRGFVLRGAGQVTKIYNDGFKPSDPGPLSPQARPKHKKGWFGL